MAQEPQDPKDEAPEDAPAEDAAPEPTAEERAAAEEVPAEDPLPAEAELSAEAPAAEAEAATSEAETATPEAETAAPEVATADEAKEDAPVQRAKPEIPGADLEVDIVPEGVDPLAPDEHAVDELAAAEDTGAPIATDGGEPEAEAEAPEPVPQATIDLGADARYRATGKRKTAVARVILRPGGGAYTVNGKPLDAHFPRPTLQRNIRQPLETVGYESRMDVVATLHGGGVSSQAGALRHGIARALIEADPNLRGELKRRGFLTRDPRVKERRKAGLKKARKRPQFSKR
jgi:small subunit ribosomal protein S9